MTKVEGIKAKHAIVTPTCRSNKGMLDAGYEAVYRLIDEYKELASLDANAEALFHFVLTVERPEKEQ